MQKEATNNQNQTFTEQDARIVINRKLQDAGGLLIYRRPSKKGIRAAHHRALVEVVKNRRKHLYTTGHGKTYSEA